jgi:hypothetical protein
MGKIVNNKVLPAKDLLKLPFPLLICTERPDFEKAIIGSGFKRFSLNLPLAQALNGRAVTEIQAVISNKAKELLSGHESIYLNDYEMLFDPRYMIDVIRLFIELAKRNQLIVKWCGTTDKDALIYAEQGYADYKRYKITDYDVVIVK